MRGAREEPNHTTARKPGPLYIIQYSPDVELGASSKAQQKWVFFFIKSVPCSDQYADECAVCTYNITVGYKPSDLPVSKLKKT